MSELIGLDVGIKEAAKMYNSSFFDSTVRLINDIKSYNKINDIKKELTALQLQKYALDNAYSQQSQSLIALAKLKSYGINEDRLLKLNNLLENNEYKDGRLNTYTSTNSIRGS